MLLKILFVLSVQPAPGLFASIFRILFFPYWFGRGGGEEGGEIDRKKMRMNFLLLGRHCTRLWEAAFSMGAASHKKKLRVRFVSQGWLWEAFEWKFHDLQAATLHLIWFRFSVVLPQPPLQSMLALVCGLPLQVQMFPLGCLLEAKVADWLPCHVMCILNHACQR